MKLSELIAQLTTKQLTHGDVDVVIEDTTWPDVAIEHCDYEPDVYPKGVVILRQKFWEDQLAA